MAALHLGSAAWPPSVTGIERLNFWNSPPTRPIPTCRTATLRSHSITARWQRQKDAAPSKKVPSDVHGAGRALPPSPAVTLIQKRTGMSVSSALRFCRGSASRVLPVLTDACLGPQALRASPRLGFLFGAAGNCRGEGWLVVLPSFKLPDQQRREEHLYCRRVTYSLSGRQICFGFEVTAAVHAGPKIQDVPFVLVFRPFRSNQQVSAFRTVHSEDGTTIRWCHDGNLPRRMQYEEVELSECVRAESRFDLNQKWRLTHCCKERSAYQGPCKESLYRLAGQGTQNATSSHRKRSSSVRAQPAFAPWASRYCLRPHFDLEGAIV